MGSVHYVRRLPPGQEVKNVHYGTDKQPVVRLAYVIVNRYLSHKLVLSIVTPAKHRSRQL